MRNPWMFAIRLACSVLIFTLLASGVWSAPREPGGESPPPGVHVIGDGIIIPGKRIGPLHLNMDLREILQVMGSGFRRDEFPEHNLILYEWRREGVWVSLYRDSQRLRLISVFGTGGYRTDRGVRLLDRIDKAIATYGNGYRRYDYPEDRIAILRYHDLGLQFAFVQSPKNLLNGRIFQIGVFKPGDLPPIKQPRQ
ncbi:MAG: hypothetical protein QN198_07325 [Armatimonadota bacterium]|nr:hypothetical protein [Armatimonadota bacterium]MDR5703399.1 hypothetical protein [Armatimonadota bacterium]MDR7434738.1 hypothetical protein [Armatimonadota bacterium]